MANTKSRFSMYYNATISIRDKAQTLKANETKAEKVLWQYLKAKQIDGFKFRRQHAIEIFIADFYCHSLKLVIELDGEIHNTKENKEHDKSRTYELEKYGITVIRFTNNEIFTNIEAVIKQIKTICTKLQIQKNIQTPQEGKVHSKPN